MGRGRRDDPTLVLEAGKPRAGQAWLVVAPDTAEARRVAVGEQALCLGKDPMADVRVLDPHVSGRHAEVRRTERGVELRDLGSRNGTHVEGLAIQSALLTSGVTFTIGRTAVRYEVEGQAARVAPLPVDAVDSRFGGAFGQSEAMRQVFALLGKVGPKELTVTLVGETGTGKDVLARAIHASSPRNGGPFVVFDCGAVAPTLIESELFGHDKGAFTGAVVDHKGAFERADRGTLFLDEIGELALDLQPKLLRALEQRRISRVGGAAEIEVDVRIVAATNRDLEAEVRAGRFRQDLFFRLAGALVPVPPLRARRDDLPGLIDHVLAELGGRLTVSRDAVAVLADYDWPGNVRELRNVITGAAAMAEEGVIEPRHFLFFKPRRRAPTLEGLPLAGRSLDAIEKATITQTLRQCDGNKTRAAKALGIAPSTLYEKIKKYGL